LIIRSDSAIIRDVSIHVPMVRHILRACLVLIAAIPAARAAEQQVCVAAAANLAHVVGPLGAEFSRLHPGTRVSNQIGSSGSLVAQIVNGSPCDVFLSADMDFPRKLVRAGGAAGATLFPFAIGKLVIWSTREGIAVTSVEAVVRSPAVRKLAIANPQVAPYGRAAMEALGSLGLAGVAGPKLVYGENIIQAAQYVVTGHADAGFVALSVVRAPGLRNQGRWLEVPADLYKPIAQGAVLTRHGAANPVARQYLHFLATPEARAILTQFGYGIPCLP
jgi:molybdate transport system substrate-binding protein